MKDINVYLLLTAAIALSLVAAHPHPLNLGECMEMRSAARGSRSLWFSHEFECMEEIEPPKEEVLARKVCKAKTRRYVMDFFKDDKIDFPKDTNVEDVTAQRDLFYAKCMVERLDLVSQNGSLNTEKVLKNAAKMDSSDSSALLHMHTWMRICLASLNGSKEMNATTTTTTTTATTTTTTTTTTSPSASTTVSTDTSISSVAAEQYMAMRSCVQQMLREHCEQEKYLVRTYLQSSSEKSECANVSAHTGVSELEKEFQTCMAQVTMEDVTESKFLPGGSVGSTRSRSAMSQMVLASTTCTMKNMKWFSPEKGLDMQNYTKYMSNFTGWEEIPHILSNLTAAMNTCLTNYTGDIYSQLYHWKFCIKPVVVDMCGFNSNVTKFVFPYVSESIRRAAKEYMQEMVDMDDEDDDGFSDDVDYDYRDDEDGGRVDDEQGDDEGFVDDEDDDNGEEKAEMVDDGLYVKGALLAAHKDFRSGRVDDEDDDSDVETMTESAERDGEEMMAQQKRIRNPLFEGPSNGSGSVGISANAKSDSSAEKKNSAKDSGASSETTELPDEMQDASTEDDLLLL